MYKFCNTCLSHARKIQNLNDLILTGAEKIKELCIYKFDHMTMSMST